MNPKPLTKTETIEAIRVLTFMLQNIQSEVLKEAAGKKLKTLILSL